MERGEDIFELNFKDGMIRIPQHLASDQIIYRIVFKENIKSQLSDIFSLTGSCRTYPCSPSRFFVGTSTKDLSYSGRPTRGEIELIRGKSYGILFSQNKQILLVCLSERR